MLTERRVTQAIRALINETPTGVSLVAIECGLDPWVDGTDVRRILRLLLNAGWITCKSDRFYPAVG
jgi:hypothetical protein